MLLIGFKNITTGTGTNENDLSHVEHQRTDIIAGSPGDTVETLAELYHAMVQKAEQSKKELSKIQDEMGWRDISNKEFEKIENNCIKLRQDLQILSYQRVIIVEGLILK